MESAARQGLRAAQARLAEMEARPPLPAAVEHLWAWWLELHSGRPTGGYGPARLGWSDIASWARLTGAAPRPTECRALLSVDALWIAEEARRIERRVQKK